MSVEEASLEEQKILEYVYFKGVCALVFSDDYEYELSRVSELIQLDSFATLELLEEVATSLQKVMDPQMKNNILNIVSYFRFEYTKDHPEEKKEVFDIANKIILTVNSSSMEKAIPFTFSEMQIRRAKGPGYFQTLRYFSDYWQMVKDECVGDFYILFSHTKYVPDEGFLDLLAEISDDKYGYASNMNSILTECPDLLKDDLFRKRLRTSISIIEKSITNPKERKDTLGEIQKIKVIAREKGPYNV